MSHSHDLLVYGAPAVLAAADLCLGYFLVQASRRADAFLERTRALQADMDGEQRKLLLEKEALFQQKEALLLEMQQLSLKNPLFKKCFTRILTYGDMGSGKTTLTKKWVNPVFHLKSVVSTTERGNYPRTVHVEHRKATAGRGTACVIEEILEIWDPPGERKAEMSLELERAAQPQNGEAADQERRFGGLLFVMDLWDPKQPLSEAAPTDKKSRIEARVQFQVQEFKREWSVLSRFPSLRDPTLVVLFINKSDILTGNAAAVEETGLRYAHSYIEAVKFFFPSVQILVGSGQSGHNTHELFALFLKKLYPDLSTDQSLGGG